MVLVGLYLFFVYFKRYTCEPIYVSFNKSKMFTSNIETVATKRVKVDELFASILDTNFRGKLVACMPGKSKLTIIITLSNNGDFLTISNCWRGNGERLNYKHFDVLLKKTDLKSVERDLKDWLIKDLKSRSLAAKHKLIEDAVNYLVVPPQ